MFSLLLKELIFYFDFPDFQQPFELALKWAVTEKFKNYLMGSHITVLIDNNSLKHILTSAKLDATGQR